MISKGYILLYRKLINWKWFKFSETLHLFIYLLLKANFKDGEYMQYVIPRGSLIFGRKKANEDTGISERSIRTSLTRLKSTNELTIKSTNKFSIISICNYDTYQIENLEIDQHIDQHIDQQPTSNRPATDHIIIKKDNDNKRNNNTFIPPHHLKDLWPDYLITRKNKRAAKTETALQRIVDDLEKFSHGDHEKQREILKKSIDSGWAGVFPLKQGFKSNERPLYEFERNAADKYRNM